MKIAVMGYGTVGMGVVKTLKMNADSIAAKSKNGKIEVKYILDIKEINDENANLVIRDINTILEDDEIKVVVETMGGLRPAFNFVSSCLAAGKSVITSNKELVAEKGPELIEIAKANKCLFEYEASVAGGIPVIRAITDSMNSNKITAMAGIINGTTNFILTKMIRENMSYDVALKQAQDNGYAEKDPTADVEGIDACRKICILSALAYGRHISPADVVTEGISSVRLDDVAEADKLGYAVKLIAAAKAIGDRISVTVSPSLVAHSSPLAFVSDVNNAVLIRGNAVNEIMLYGPGAGSLPTASAVVSDVIDCCNKYGTVEMNYSWPEAEEGFIVPVGDVETKLYARIAGAVDSAEFEAVVTAENGDTIVITKSDKESALRAVVAKYGDKVLSVLRVSDF